MKIEEAREYHMIEIYNSSEVFNKEVSEYLSNNWHLSGTTKIITSSSGATTFYQLVIR